MICCRTLVSRPTFCALVLAACLGISGCSLLSGAGARPKPVDLEPNTALFDVHLVWKVDVGSIAGLPMKISVYGKAVTIASALGTVTQIDANSGLVTWRAKVADALSAGVGSDGTRSAVVSRENELIVIEGGEVLWRQSLSAQVFTAPLVAGDRVFVLTADRSLAAFDAQTGAQLWTRPGAGVPLALRQAGVLAGVNNTLVVGIGGRLVGINPDTGDTLWDAALANPRGTNDVERLVELVAPLEREGSSVCARAFQTGVACVDLAQGQVTWAQKAEGATGLTGDNDAVFGAEFDGRLLAWSRSNGSRIWESNRLQYRHLSAPLLLGRSIVVGDGAGLVHFLSREDGSPLNRLTTDGSAVEEAPVLAVDTLIVVTRKGGVFGFRPN